MDTVKDTMCPQIDLLNLTITLCEDSIERSKKLLTYIEHETRTPGFITSSIATLFNRIKQNLDVFDRDYKGKFGAPGELEEEEKPGSSKTRPSLSLKRTDTEKTDDGKSLVITDCTCNKDENSDSQDTIIYDYKEEPAGDAEVVNFQSDIFDLLYAEKIEVVENEIKENLSENGEILDYNETNIKDSIRRRKVLQEVNFSDSDPDQSKDTRNKSHDRIKFVENKNTRSDDSDGTIEDIGDKLETLIDNFLEETVPMKPQEQESDDEDSEKLADKALDELEPEFEMNSDISDIEKEYKSLIGSDTEIEADDETDEETNDERQPKRTKVLDKHQEIESKVVLTPIDKISFREMRKLCTLHDLNKKKCDVFRDIASRPHPRRKVLKLANTSSSSSSSSLSLSDFSESSKSSSEFEEVPFEVRSKNNPISDDDEEMAETICNHLNDKTCSEEDDDDDEEEKDGERPKEKVDKDKNAINELESVDIKEEMDSEEKEAPKKSKKRPYDALLDKKLWSSSDDDRDVNDDPDKARVKRKRPNSPKSKSKCVSLITDDESSSDLEDEVVEDNDSDVEFISESLFDTGKGRRDIRPILDDDSLTQETQIAIKEEDTRLKRLEERTKAVESVQSQHEEFILDVDEETGKPLIIVNETLTERLKPHQKEGIQFMWDACYESVKMIEKNNGTGCILAHCMGLGKTLQVITLIHTLFQHQTLTKTNHVLIIVPKPTVWNWKNEFTQSLKHVIPLNFQLNFIDMDRLEFKCNIVKMWQRNGGVLVMGYQSYTRLVSDKLNAVHEPNKIYEALVDPGPDLVVCDEGHLIKNAKAERSKALAKIKTKRRIVLTGTPLQNNLKEYYVMVEFVKPNLLGTSREFNNRFLTPIMNGQLYNSNGHDIHLMKKRTHVLNKLLKGTLQRIPSDILKSYLPKIYDYAIFIKMNVEQAKIYKQFVDTAKSTLNTNDTNKKKWKGFLYDFHISSLLCLHPQIINAVVNKRNAIKAKKPLREDQQQAQEETVAVEKQTFLHSLLPPDVETSVDYSPKLRILFEIIEACKKISDKLLIFSSSLQQLDCVEHFFKQRGIIKNLHYYRMDGNNSNKDRSFLCQSFNRPTNNVGIFLISQRVGGLGLNLTAANRVVLLGSNFNPCYDSQSIYRTYRFGQEKQVFVYRLIAKDTMDEKVYNKCMVKLAVAHTVVDKSHVARHYKGDDLHFMYEYEITNEERSTPLVPVDKVLANVLQNNSDCFKYNEQEALLENRPEEELDDEEKKMAWEEFNNANIELQAAAAAAAAAVVSAPVVQQPNPDPNLKDFNALSNFANAIGLINSNYTMPQPSTSTAIAVPYLRPPPPPPYVPKKLQNNTPKKVQSGTAKNTQNGTPKNTQNATNISLARSIRQSGDFLKPKPVIKKSTNEILQTMKNRIVDISNMNKLKPVLLEKPTNTPTNTNADVFNVHNKTIKFGIPANQTVANNNGASSQNIIVRQNNDVVDITDDHCPEFNYTLNTYV